MTTTLVIPMPSLKAGCSAVSSTVGGHSDWHTIVNERHTPGVTRRCQHLCVCTAIKHISEAPKEPSESPDGA